MNSFLEGYRNIEKSIGSYGAVFGNDYISRVENEISKLNSDINNFKGFNTPVDKLKGDVAEFWHSGTHNIDAAVKSISSRTQVDRSHDFASADLTSNFGEIYGLKYLKDGASSAKAQSTSFFERYKQDGKPGQSFAEFLKERSISESDVLSHDSIYQGQVRIIPKDQLKDAVVFLKRKITEESLKRPELVHKYEETLNKLTDKIESSEGSKSIPLSEAEAKELASLAKDGNFKSSDYGLTTEELINFKLIMNQALKAGLTAATISAVLRVAPEIYKTIDQLIHNGEIDKERLEKIGFSTLQGGAEGFIRGSISSALTISCLSGHFGSALKDVDPSIIGVATVIVINTIRNSLKVATNKMTKGEFADACMRDLFVSTCSIASGGVTQGLIQVPILGYMLGSFIGSVAASFIYDAGYKTYISFCIDSGFTFFGIVEQDYVLPNEILESIGIKILEYEKLCIQKLEYKTLNVKRLQVKRLNYKTLDITFIRRGVIGVNKVAYI